MPTLTFPHLPANLDALDYTLRAALPAVLLGVSTTPDALLVHLAESTAPDQLAQARTLVLAHDPAVLSPRQQAEKNRLSALAISRTDNALNPLDLAQYDTLTTAEKTVFIRRLVQKLIWLEKEVIHLTRS